LPRFVRRACSLRQLFPLRLLLAAVPERVYFRRWCAPRELAGKSSRPNYLLSRRHANICCCYSAATRSLGSMLLLPSRDAGFQTRNHNARVMNGRLTRMVNFGVFDRACWRSCIHAVRVFKPLSDILLASCCDVWTMALKQVLD
jgi:hypothetical protein